MNNLKQQEIKFYDGLFEEIISYTNLNEAFYYVRKNKGAPGIDNVSIKEFEKRKETEIRKLIQEVEGWRYKPSPVKRVEIPKPNGGIRLLGIPTIRDRVIQAGIKLKLEPIYEEIFSDNSYGFRPGRNQAQAVESAREIVETGKEYVVDMDLSKFFDRINHDRLIHRLSLRISDKKVLRLIGIILRSGTMDKGEFIQSREGTVQGSPLSPLLSNIVLDELDKELEKRGLEFCRFADDCNIFAGSRKAAERIRESITKFITKKLKLRVNEEKTRVDLSKRVKFLGMTIIAGLMSTVCISSKSMDRAMDKVEKLSQRNTNQTIEKSIDEYNQWYRGWSNYHKITNYPSQFRKLEAHFRRRLRARILKNQKQKRYLCKKLIKRGAPKSLVFKTVYTNSKTWSLSKSRAVHKAYSNKWFIEELGQFIMSDNELEHWLNFNYLPKLS